MEIRTNEASGYPRYIAAHKDGDMNPVVEATMEDIHNEGIHTFETVVESHGTQHIKDSFKTTSKYLKDVASPTVSIKDVALFQYNLPRDVHGTFHSLCVTVGLQDLSTFIFSGKKSTTKTTTDPFFMLGYSPGAKMPKILNCKTRSPVVLHT